MSFKEKQKRILRARDVESRAYIMAMGIMYASLERKSLWLLPAEVLVCEVTVLGGLEVDGLGQLELLDDNSWAEIEVLVDDLDELVRGLVGGSVRVNEDGEGLCDTDGV